jgi:hypothetical protein
MYATVGLTDNMLDDDLHSPEWHVATRYAVGSTSAPLVRRHSLQEVFNCREQFYWVKFQVCEVLRNVPGQFPNALQNKFRDLGFLGIGVCAVRWERPDYLEEESE